MTNAHDLEKGDEVSWKWGAGQPTGTVEDVVDGDASITTNKGNSVSRHGDEENPAVKIKASSGNHAIKLASELVGVETGAKESSGAQEIEEESVEPESEPEASAEEEEEEKEEEQAEEESTRRVTRSAAKKAAE